MDPHRLRRNRDPSARVLHRTRPAIDSVGDTRVPRRRVRLRRGSNARHFGRSLDPDPSPRERARRGCNSYAKAKEKPAERGRTVYHRTPLGGRARVAVYRIDEDAHLIEQHLPVDDSTRMVNALVIQARRPVLIDTCYPVLGRDFVSDLSSILNPAEIAFVGITHADPDHTGALVALLALAPDAKVLTNEMGRAKLMGDFGLVQERFHLM